MNIIVDKNLLYTPLSKLVGITERRSIMPILSNILIDFSENQVSIYSTDLEMSGMSHVPYEKGAGVTKKVVVHGRKFFEILREMESDTIDLSFMDNHMTLRQGHSEFVLTPQDPEEYPEVKEVSGIEEFILKGSVFTEMMDKVSFAVSSDEARYVLTGMYMIGSEGRVSVVGTDGFRMALYEKDVIIPKRSVVEVGKMVEEDEGVRFVIGEKHIQFSTPAVTVISRLIEGNFPDYENVIPKTNSNVASLEKVRFIKGLRKVATIISKSEPIKITLSDSEMAIEAESEIGRAREVLEIDYKGENLTMNFNVRFVMDVINHLEGERIVMKAPTSYGAVLFSGDDEAHYKNIVMPIRV
jgi:DNA polymerase-3 subunit beta